MLGDLIKVELASISISRPMQREGVNSSLSARTWAGDMRMCMCMCMCMYHI